MYNRIAYHDLLLEALAEPDCAFCRLLDQSSNRLVESVLFEMVNDVGIREEVNAARGYCRRHAALFDRQGSALGSTMIMQGVLKMLIRILEAEQPGTATSSRLKKLRRSLDDSVTDPTAVALAETLSPQSPCPICANEDEVLTHLTRTLLDNMQPGSEVAVAYRQSAGLCLPHFRHVAGRALSGPELTELVEAQREIWQRLEAELEEFLRKSDYRFAHENMGPESDAWRRALAAVSGTPNGRRK